jgi:hypothetical protein
MVERRVSTEKIMPLTPILHLIQMKIAPDFNQRASALMLTNLVQADPLSWESEWKAEKLTETEKQRKL